MACLIDSSFPSLIFLPCKNSFSNRTRVQFYNTEALIAKKIGFGKGRDVNKTDWII